jgi:hypothetical protein
MHLRTGGLPRIVRRALIVIGVGAAVVAAAYYAGSGTVIDDATGRPIEGAYVIQIWTGRQITPVESSTVCFKVASTKTNSRGHYMLWPVSGNLHPLLWSREYELLVYKFGYRPVDDLSVTRDPIRLKSDLQTLTDKYRAALDVAGRASCGTANQRQAYLRPLYLQMISDANTVNDERSSAGFLVTMKEFLDFHLR